MVISHAARVTNEDDNGDNNRDRPVKKVCQYPKAYGQFSQLS